MEISSFLVLMTGQVILWNWESASTVKLSFDSGHRDNIFQAKFMPFSDDRSIVTSAADGQVHPLFLTALETTFFLHSYCVYAFHILQYSLRSGKVETCLLGEHQGQVHKLAVEPASPFTFFTCGEDGVVKHVSFPLSRKNW